MNALVLGLYAEGRTDERFLPIIIQRTTQRILDQHDRMDIDAQPVLVIKKSLRCSSLEQCILQAARAACGYSVLVVHSDGDDRSYKQTLQERFYPGYGLVQQTEEDICKSLVPIVPIRMVEAWMLADPEALQKAMNTTLGIRTLRVPAKAKLVESITYPKETLHQVVQKVHPGQPRRWSRAKSELYETLAPIISLDRLNQVPSYKQFVADLTVALKILNLIQ
jgi:Domain of unknown function (DUF4276)